MVVREVVLLLVKAVKTEPWVVLVCVERRQRLVNRHTAVTRRAEERMCTSVYYLSQATRCERLAIELTSRWLVRYQIAAVGAADRCNPAEPAAAFAAFSGAALGIRVPRAVWRNAVDLSPAY